MFYIVFISLKKAENFLNLFLVTRNKIFPYCHFSICFPMKHISLIFLEFLLRSGCETTMALSMDLSRYSKVFSINHFIRLFVTINCCIPYGFCCRVACDVKMSHSISCPTGFFFFLPKKKKEKKKKLLISFVSVVCNHDCNF